MSNVAQVLNSSRNEITFLVNDVEPGQERYPTHPAVARMEAQTSHRLLASSHSADFMVLQDSGHHPLVSAVHIAFSQHYPLVLSPDAIWITIAQGLAHHINNNSEKLRSQLVRHEGKIAITVEVDDLSKPEHWAGAIDGWVRALEHGVTADLRGLMLCDFSTTTPSIRTASAVVMMDALRNFFDYQLVCICGIPQITLQGTADDWRSIRDRVERIAHLDLSWWTDRLLPICDGLIATAEGSPSRRFWQDIYKPKELYGGDLITGWVADLFPYLVYDITKAATIKNHMLFTSRAELHPEEGIQAMSLPNGLSHAPVTLTFLQSPTEKPLQLLGGLIGVTQNPATGSVQPEIGWGVQELDDFDQILNRLKLEHHTLPPTEVKLQDSSGAEPYVGAAPAETYDTETSRYYRNFREILDNDGIPAEIIQICEQFDGAELFKNTSHSWRMRKRRDYARHEVAGTYTEVICFADLSDGRAVGYACQHIEDDTVVGQSEWRTEWWIVVGSLGLRYSPRHHRDVEMLTEQSQVISRGVRPLFERLLATEGRFYFDEPEFLPDAAFTPLPDDLIRLQQRRRNPLWRLVGNAAGFVRRRIRN